MGESREMEKRRRRRTEVKTGRRREIRKGYEKLGQATQCRGLSPRICFLQLNLCLLKSPPPPSLMPPAAVKPVAYGPGDILDL